MNSCTVGAREVGDRDDLALVPQPLVGKLRYRTHMYAAAYHATALAYRAQRLGHERPDRREQNGGVERLRR